MNIKLVPMILVAFSALGAGKEPDQTKRSDGMERATFAGGCFWCMESPFEKLDGVIEVVSGYTDGDKKDPTYEEVSAGSTGHTEAVQIVFDPKRISYAKLLEVFWRQVDPIAVDSQFCDVGTQYRSGIYYHDDAQRQLAEASKVALESSGKIKGKIATELDPATRFYPAEDYHQDYYKKNPIRYSYYRNGCGRDRRLEQVWGKESK